MTIHDTHPFADPDPDPVRRFRGRLGGAVTLWSAGSGPDRVGLTVSSLVVALGEPSHVIGLLDPDADLTEALRDTGRAVVQVAGVVQADGQDLGWLTGSQQLDLRDLVRVVGDREFLEGAGAKVFH